MISDADRDGRDVHDEHDEFMRDVRGAIGEEGADGGDSDGGVIEEEGARVLNDAYDDDVPEEGVEVVLNGDFYGGAALVVG